MCVFVTCIDEIKSNRFQQILNTKPENSPKNFGINFTKALKNYKQNGKLVNGLNLKYKQLFCENLKKYV